MNKMGATPFNVSKILIARTHAKQRCIRVVSYNHPRLVRPQTAHTAHLPAN